QCALVAVVGGADVVEGQHDRTGHSVLEGGDLFGGRAQGGGELGRGRHVAVLVGQVLTGSLHGASRRPQRAGRPVSGAGGVEDGTPDASGGEPGERHAAALV